MAFANLGYDVALIPAGTVVTATGSGPTLELDNRNTLRVQSVVTAVSGTSPSVTVQLQTSHDGATWASLGSAFTAQTAANDSGVKLFSPIDRFVRANYTVTGTTPSLTFGVYGEAV